MSYRLDRLKVLVVDDNKHMRLLVSAVLEAFGVKTIYEAANGEDAWKILTQNPCDIVFVDWVMPGMSGVELTEKIRTAPDSPNPFLPIVMLTGHTSIEKVNLARNMGVNEFLAKPVSAKAIINRMVAVIEHPRPFVRTKSYFGPCRRRREVAYQGPERRSSDSELRNPSATAA
jgi:two-component system, chemotaxis family, chemotaxis protein CheY